MCSRRRYAATNATRHTAFSLLEVMVVLVIIGLVLGITTVHVIGQLGAAKHDTAVAQIGAMNAAVNAYYVENGRYPTNDEGLEILLERSRKSGEPFMLNLPKDPWGRPYDYRSPGLDGAPFEVISYGADGQEGGDGQNADVISSQLNG